jgi:hypothetical protein
MTRREINLIGGFYKDSSLPWSAQDTVNWLPVPAQEGGTRSPMKLRGAPGLRALSVSVEELGILGDAPDTTCGAAYSYSYTPDGGTAPYVWSIVSGQLPEGATFSAGTISAASILCNAIEFGEVTAPPFLPSQLTGFNTDTGSVFPSTAGFRTVGAGIRTILLVMNVGTSNNGNQCSYEANLNGSPVATFGPVTFGTAFPRRYFAFDVVAGDVFFIERTEGVGSQTGRFYAYTETIQDLFPGSPVGGDGGGVFEFVIGLSDAAGLSATLSDSITVTSP